MYGTLAIRPKALDAHLPIIGEEKIDELHRLAEPLRGLRVLHLSVTGFGTGVAELLNASVPLFSDIGLECSWQVVHPTEESAAANNALYRALRMPLDERRERHRRMLARLRRHNVHDWRRNFMSALQESPREAA